MKPHMSAEKWKELIVIAKKYNHMKPSKPFSKDKTELIHNILDRFNLKYVKPIKSK